LSGSLQGVTVRCLVLAFPSPFGPFLKIHRAGALTMPITAVQQIFYFPFILLDVVSAIIFDTGESGPPRPTRSWEAWPTRLSLPARFNVRGLCQEAPKPPEAARCKLLREDDIAFVLFVSSLRIWASQPKLNVHMQRLLSMRQRLAPIYMRVCPEGCTMYKSVRAVNLPVMREACVRDNTRPKGDTRYASLMTELSGLGVNTFTHHHAESFRAVLRR
jgi:hypothetical protein